MKSIIQDKDHTIEWEKIINFGHFLAKKVTYENLLDILLDRERSNEIHGVLRSLLNNPITQYTDRQAYSWAKLIVEVVREQTKYSWLIDNI